MVVVVLFLEIFDLLAVFTVLNIFLTVLEGFLRLPEGGGAVLLDGFVSFLFVSACNVAVAEAELFFAAVVVVSAFVSCKDKSQ